MHLDKTNNTDREQNLNHNKLDHNTYRQRASRAAVGARNLRSAVGLGAGGAREDIHAGECSKKITWQCYKFKQKLEPTSRPLPRRETSMR